MTRHRKSLELLLVLVLTGAGCPKRPEVIRPDNAKAAFEQAMEALEARRFQQAEDGFTFVIFNFPGSRQAADAQFYLAETYYRKRDFDQARTEFDFYLRSFPNGAFEEEAAFKLAMSNFHSAPRGTRDQSRTVEAQKGLEDFISLYPDSEFRVQAEAALGGIARRLTERDFAAANLYFQAGEYVSALVYYEYTLEQVPAEQWRAPDLLRLGICYQDTGQPDKAIDVFERLLDRNCPDRIRLQAGSRLAAIRNAMESAPPDSI